VDAGGPFSQLICRGGAGRRGCVGCLGVKGSWVQIPPSRQRRSPDERKCGQGFGFHLWNFEPSPEPPKTGFGKRFVVHVHRCVGCPVRPPVDTQLWAWVGLACTVPELVAPLMGCSFGSAWTMPGWCSGCCRFRVLARYRFVVQGVTAA
jgi:hypothetical protein